MTTEIRSPGQTPSAAEDGLFSRTYLHSTIGFACVMFLMGFAALALVTTMPVAVRELDGLRFYALVFGGFVAASLFGSVLAGQLTDRYGPRRPLLAGLVLSVVGLVIAGSATTVWQLVAGRVVDGLAASTVTVAVNVTIGRTYPAGLRPRALALMSTCWIIPSLAGPPVAGLVTEWYSWRWVFFALAVLTAVPAFFAWRGAPDTGSEEAEGPGRAAPAAVAAVGAGLLQYAASAWDLWHLLFAVAGAALLLPALPRLLPGGTLRAGRGIPSVVLLGGLAAGSYFTLESFLPLMLIRERGVSVTAASIIFTAATLTWAGASWLQGHTLSALPRHRLVAGGAGAVTAAALLAVAGASGGAPVLLTGAALAVAGLGMGVLLPSLTVLVLEYCPPREQGRYSAALQVAQGIGQVLLMGLAGALFNAGSGLGAGGGEAYTVPFAVVLAVTAGACLLALRVRPRTAPDQPNVRTD
ncbi:MFS transporter [Streptomyces sp. NPDC015346]|uniref:MFS transporter n=1 Tax=Streptomyces sp. NPDC015346 TaxID=3364954 RepID=UPI0036FFAAFB